MRRHLLATGAICLLGAAILPPRCSGSSVPAHRVATPAPAAVHAAAVAVAATTTTAVPGEPPVLPPALDPASEAAAYAAVMGGYHMGQPYGVPADWSWARHSEVDSPTNEGMAAMTAWGQIYADATATEPAPGSVRVEISDMRSMVWSKSAHAWIVVQNSILVEGGHYLENFAGNRSVGADVRTEPDGGTSVSMVPGFNFHFWPETGRASVPAGDIGAVITLYEARLIGPEAGLARYLANVGGDWWRNLTVSFNYSGPGGNNRQIGEGRFAYLSPNWTTVAFYTGGP